MSISGFASSSTKRYRAFAQLRSRAEQLAGEGRYRTAFDLVQRGPPDRRMRAIHDRWDALRGEIRRRSNEDWHAEKRAAKERSPGDLDAVVTLFDEYRAALAGDYVVEGPQAAIALERIEIQARAEEAAAIQERVAAFEARFSEAAVEGFVRQDQVANVRGAAERGAEALRTFVGAQWGACRAASAAWTSACAARSASSPALRTARSPAASSPRPRLSP